MKIDEVLIEDQQLEKVLVYSILILLRMRETQLGIKKKNERNYVNLMDGSKIEFTL